MSVGQILPEEAYSFISPRDSKNKNTAVSFEEALTRATSDSPRSPSDSSGREDKKSGSSSGSSSPGRSSPSDSSKPRPGHGVGEGGNDIQRQTADCLATLMSNPAILDVLKSKNMDGGGGISARGLAYIAHLDVNDPDASKWGGVTDRGARQAAQTAARLLLGEGTEEQKPISTFFYSALASEGSALSINIDEIKEYISSPASIPGDIVLAGEATPGASSAYIEMQKIISGFASEPELMKILTNGEGQVIDVKQMTMLAKADVRLGMGDEEWGDIPPDKRQGIQNGLRILLGSEWIDDQDQIDIANAFAAEMTPEGSNEPLWEIPVDKFNNLIHDGIIDSSDVHQMSEGNCCSLMTISAIAQTPEGQQILKDSIHDNGDGTWDVTFRGNPEMPIRITQGDLEHNYSSGDGDVEILNAALEKFRDVNVGSAAIFPDIASILLGADSTISDYGETEAENRQYLIDMAPHIGVDTVIHLNASVGENSTIDFTKGGGQHAFYISNIDVATNTVTYRNPWDTSIEYTCTIDVMAKYNAERNVGYETATIPGA